MLAELLKVKLKHWEQVVARFSKAHAGPMKTPHLTVVDDLFCHQTAAVSSSKVWETIDTKTYFTADTLT